MLGCSVESLSFFFEVQKYGKFFPHFYLCNNRWIPYTLSVAVHCSRRPNWNLYRHAYLEISTKQKIPSGSTYALDRVRYVIKCLIEKKVLLITRKMEDEASFILVYDMVPLDILLPTFLFVLVVGPINSAAMKASCTLTP
jgi:hypothetical protein